MPDVFLRSESDSELRFAHSFLGGWIFAGIGCAVVYYGLWHAESTSARWLASGIGGFFAAIGVGGALWRYQLIVDLTARSYRRRRGFWPSPKTLEGSLSELAGVLLSRSWRRSDKSEHPVWVISLDFRGWEKPVSVFETTGERKGYAQLEKLARRLDVPAIDRTADGPEVVRSPDALDQPAAERTRPVESTHEIGDPPTGSGIESSKTETGAPMIILPALGVGGGSVFLALFGSPFLAFGAVALASGMGWTGIEVHGSLAAKWIVGGVFVLLGIAGWAGAILGPVAREIIHADGDALVVSLRAFGYHYRVRHLPRRAIEEISIKPTRSSARTRASRGSGVPKTDVVLRTDDSVVRIAGDLPPDGQRWLARMLLALASR